MAMMIFATAAACGLYYLATRLLLRKALAWRER
jgi:hypothetical protein